MRRHMQLLTTMLLFSSCVWADDKPLQASASCQINETMWGACKHEKQDPLASGARLTVMSTDGLGSVTYRCDHGSLKTEDMSCTSPLITPAGAASGKSVAKAQNTATTTSTKVVTLTRTKTYPTSTDTNASSFKTAMNQYVQDECARIDGNKLGTATYAITGRAASSVAGKDTLTVQMSCNVNVALRCDQTYMDDFGPGDYSNQTNEYSDVPGYATLLKRYCNHQSAYSNTAPSPYTELSKVLYLDLAHPGRTPWDVDTLEIDNYQAVLVCGGNTAQCNSGTVDAQPEIKTVLSCTEAQVNHPAIIETYDSGRVPEVTKDYACEPFGSGQQACIEADSVLEYACKPLGFTSMKSFTVGGVVNGSASPRQRDVTAVCSGYQGTTPLSDGCALNTFTEGPKSVQKTDCNSAKVTGQIAGDKDPASGTLTISPSDASVQQKLCKAAGYSTLSSVLSNDVFTSSTYANIYNVVAQCTDIVTVDPYCKSSDPCRGAPVDAADPRPKFCDNTGCVLNTCAVITPPTDLCKECTPTTLSFTDPGNGQSCTITTNTLVSGATTTISFLNATENGEASVRCNNGVASVTGGTCFRSCPGGVSLSWDGGNVANSCNQTVPAGNYKHGQTVSLSTSQTNSGSASAMCNNGNWEIQAGAQCDLDCSGPASWGSGTAAGGQDKTGACSVPSVLMKHNQSMTVSTSAPGTSGTATLTCSNGTLGVSGATCNVGCGTESVTWGSGMCQATLNALSDTVSQTVTAIGNSTLPYAWSASGSATYQCADGKHTLSSSSCKYIVSENATNWTNWENSGGPVNCTAWTPDPSTQPGSTSFEQTQTCDQQQKRTRTVSYIWNDGTSTLKENETQTQTIQVSEKRVEVGTGPLAGPSCRYDASNHVAYTSWMETVLDPYRDGEYYTEYREQATFVWDGVVENVWISNWGVWDGMKQPDINQAMNGDFIWAKDYQGTDGLNLMFGICRESTSTVDTIVSTTYGPWDPWYDVGLQYDCGAWSPDVADIAANTPFTATQTCKQKQARERDVFNVWSSGRQTLKSRDKEFQEILVTNTDARVGTKVAVVVNNTTICTPYSEVGSLFNCGAWTPEASTMPIGEEYDATRPCQITERRMCTTTYQWSDGTSTQSPATPEDRVVGKTEPGKQIGTKNTKMDVVEAGCYVDTVAFDYFTTNSCHSDADRFLGQGAKIIFSVGNVMSASGDYRYFDFPATVTWSGCTPHSSGDWCVVERTPSCTGSSQHMNCPAVGTATVEVTVSYLGVTKSFTITANDNTKMNNGTPEP